MPQFEHSTAEWQALDAAHHLHPFTDFQALARKGTRVIERGEGVWLWDTDGQQIFDAMSGLWCVNVGYGQQALVDAAAAQMQRLPFYNSFFQTTTPPAIALSHKLAQISPPQFNHVFYGSSGSESNDTVVRMVRRYWDILGQPQRQTIIFVFGKIDEQRHIGQIGRFVQTNLHKDIDLLVTQPISARCLPCAPGIGAAHSDFAFFHREIDFIATRIAGDDFKARANQRIHRFWILRRCTAACGTCGHIARLGIFNRLDGRCVPGEADDTVRRHAASPFQLRDVQQLHESSARPNGDLEESGSIRHRRAPPAEKAGRRGGSPAFGETGREVDQAEPGSSQLSRHSGRRALQAGALPVLTGVMGDRGRSGNADRPSGKIGRAHV